MPATKTQIVDTVYDSAGNPANGTLTLSVDAPFTSPDGYVVAQGSSTVTITDGAVNLSLIPGTYNVAYRLADYTGSTVWTVPTSALTLRISDL